MAAPGHQLEGQAVTMRKPPWKAILWWYLTLLQVFLINFCMQFSTYLSIQSTFCNKPNMVCWLKFSFFSTYPPCPMTGSIFTFCCTLSPFFSLAEQIPCHSYKWNVGIIIHCVQNINPRAFSTSGFHSFTMATKAIRIIKSSQPQR